MKTKLIVALSALAVLGAFGYFYSDWLTKLMFQPTETALEIGVKLDDLKRDWAVEVVAENLDIPWEIAFLPNGEILVTERPGTLRRLNEAGQVFTIEGVQHVGEGGLQGLAVDPAFTDNGYIYLYLTSAQGSGLVNRVDRYALLGDRLVDRTEIISNIPGAKYHDGGRIAFGPDGYLYIATGDATDEAMAQDTTSLAGKILRINSDGSIPDDNPFGNAVWSYGHRNPQGLAWDDVGRLWSSEHGRSVPQSGYDELNLILPGDNYGWPDAQGDETQSGMNLPAVHSGPDETWAPAGLAHLDGRLYFAGLRGESLYAVPVDESGALGQLKVHFRGDFGRLRAVAVGPDGNLYVSTSNTDGRGEARTGDDKILKINPILLR
jgi:glucose/arabinose dehydrogenase